MVKQYTLLVMLMVGCLFGLSCQVLGALEAISGRVAGPTAERVETATAIRTAGAPPATADPAAQGRATSAPVVAPKIPASDMQYEKCFACHGPGELPSIPDHSVMQDDRKVCMQCHGSGN